MLSVPLIQAQTMLLQWIDELPKGPKTPIHTLDFIVVGPITEESKLVSGKCYTSAHT